MCLLKNQHYVSPLHAIKRGVLHCLYEPKPIWEPLALLPPSFVRRDSHPFFFLSLLLERNNNNNKMNEQIQRRRHALLPLPQFPISPMPRPTVSPSLTLSNQREPIYIFLVLMSPPLRRLPN